LTKRTTLDTITDRMQNPELPEIWLVLSFWQPPTIFIKLCSRFKFSPQLRTSCNFGCICTMENWQLLRQLCWSTKLCDKVARLLRVWHGSKVPTSSVAWHCCHIVL